jgi:hypothetical protein
LKQLSECLHASGRLYMFELLVPPHPDQLQRLGNDKKAYDLRLRPTLMVEAIHELPDSGSSWTSGKSKALIGKRIAKRSSRRPDVPAATRSAASSGAAARMTRRCASG